MRKVTQVAWPAALAAGTWRNNFSGFVVRWVKVAKPFSYRGAELATV
jgi:hypothetical protein